MTAGCRAVLLAATAFWLAGRRLFKARSNGIGVGVFRQDGTSDRPLPVSISGADRVLVAHRDASCVTGFHPVGSSSQQQIWRVVVQQACSAGCTSRARTSCLARWTCTWRWPRRDLSIGVRDVDAGLGERRQQAGCVAVAALLTEWRARGSCVTARLHSNPRGPNPSPSSPMCCPGSLLSILWTCCGHGRSSGGALP